MAPRAPKRPASSASGSPEKRSNLAIKEHAAGPPSDVVNDLNSCYQSSDADIILISAGDELHFRCHSFKLMSASKVFEHMMSAQRYQIEDNPRGVNLTDEKLESGASLRLLLDCFYSDWDSVFCNPKSLRRAELITLVRLFDKWDCPTVVRVFARMLENTVVVKGLCPITTFTVVAHMRDVDLCALAIERGANWHWVSDGPKKLSNGVKGGHVFDLRTMGIAEFRLIPIVLSATIDENSVKTNPGAPKDWKKVSEEFKRLWKEDKESKHWSGERRSKNSIEQEDLIAGFGRTRSSATKHRDGSWFGRRADSFGTWIASMYANLYVEDQRVFISTSA